MWIVKLVHKKESFFHSSFERKFEQEKCWSSLRKYKCYAEVLSEFFDDKYYLLSEKNLLLSGDIDLNPGRPAKILTLLSYGRRFMYSCSSYF